MTKARTTALALTALAAVAVAGCGVEVDIGADTTRRVETERLPADGLAALEVDTSNGTVAVSAGDVDEIVVDVTLRESDEGDAEYTIETDDDRLVVRGECDGHWWDECEVGFEILVPAAIDVDVRSDNGEVTVAGIDGDVDAHSSNGRIELTGLTGDVTVLTDNGRIDAARLAAAIVEARSDNGRISLAFATAPASVQAITDNGAIDISVPGVELGYDVDADSSHGHVDVDVPLRTGADHRIVAETDNGAIDIGPAT